MSFGYYYNLNSNPNLYPNVNFRAQNTVTPSAPLTKPIKNVQKSIEGTVDTFVKKVDEEKNKKSNKKAIAVGSSVLVLSAFVALLNPKYSSKLVDKLKTLSQKAGTNIEKHKSDAVRSKLYKTWQNLLNWGGRTLEFTNNINSVKDIGFTWLCCEKKGFHKVQNKTFRGFLKTCDEYFVKVMNKVHKGITHFFDSVSKKTVRMKYNQSLKKMNEVEALIQQYKGKLPASEAAQLDAKLAEIAKLKEYIAEANVTQRLVAQEGLMSNLERDVLKKYRSYTSGFNNRWIDKAEHIGSNMSFWADDIMRPTRDKVERQGLDVIEKVVGNGKDQKGLYNEVMSIISPHLSVQEKTALESTMSKASEKIRKANHSECIEYFGKKRDLVLGSAPTDILTATVGLTAGGVALATADNKEQRMSRMLTGVFPVVAGLGSTMILTAMLFSGTQGLLLGGAIGLALSKIGSWADHYLLGNKSDEYNKKKPVPEKTSQTKEVASA